MFETEPDPFDLHGPHLNAFQEIPRDPRQKIPLPETEATVAAIQDEQHPWRQEHMVHLIATRRHSVDHDFDAIMAQRPDLTPEDMHQIAALAIMEAATEVNTETMSVDLSLPQAIPRKLDALLEETKLAPEYSATLPHPRRVRSDSPIDRAVPYEKTPMGNNRHLNIEDELMDQVGLKELADQFMSHLSSAQRAVIEARFGINGQEQQTLADLAAAHGVSVQEIRQIEQSGMRAMRAHASKLLV